MWKTVPNFPNYLINKCGKIKSIYRGRNTGRILRQHTSYGGYSTVVLGCNGTMYNLYVHRLLLEAFVGPCPNDMEACHNNGNPADNRLENLRWDTCSNNVKDAISHGTARCVNQAGEQHHNAKLTNKKVQEIRKLSADGIAGIELSKVFCISKAQISRILTRKRWKHI